MNRQNSDPSANSRSEIPSSVLDLLKKMDPKQRQDLLRNLLQDGNQRLGIYNRDQNVFFQFV